MLQITIIPQGSATVSVTRAGAALTTYSDVHIQVLGHGGLTETAAGAV